MQWLLLEPVAAGCMLAHWSQSQQARETHAKTSWQHELRWILRAPLSQSLLNHFIGVEPGKKSSRST